MSKLNTALTVFSLGLDFALCHRDFDATRDAIKQLKKDFEEIRDMLPNDAWVELTAQVLNTQPEFLDGSLWVSRNGEVYANGQYEWRQGSNPDRIYVEGMDLHAIGCFVMPMYKPAAPADSKEGE